MNLILLDFIIGSSYLIFIGFFIFVYKKIIQKKININYFDYTLIMPLWFGLLNVLSGLIQRKFNINDILRYFIISIIGLIVVVTVISYMNIYNYNKKDFSKHIINVIITYFLIWIALVNSIQKIILNKKFHNYELFIFVIIIILYLLINKFNKINN